LSKGYSLTGLSPLPDNSIASCWQKGKEYFHFLSLFFRDILRRYDKAWHGLSYASIQQATFPHSPENYLENKNFTFLKKSFITV